ncbi:MAG: helix-turn-helix transcriptional regulator [Phycisphaerales bacterium]|nr:helix-turn-helix transcriptional regulator [Phycisphaerales bacterium]
MKLADKVGVHFTYLSDVERGNRNIALVNIVRVARALDVPLDKFFAEVEAQLARYSHPTK